MHELAVAELHQVIRGQQPGGDVVEGDVAHGLVAATGVELGDPPADAPVRDVVKELSRHLGVPVDDGDMNAFLHRPPQKLRPAGGRDRDELSHLLGKEDVKSLGFEVRPAFGGEEQRLVTEVARRL